MAGAMPVPAATRTVAQQKEEDDTQARRPLGGTVAFCVAARALLFLEITMSQEKGRITLENGELSILELSTSDTITVAHVEKQPQETRADAVRNALQLGARVIEYASDQLGAAEVAQKIDASVETVAKLLRSAGASAQQTIEAQLSGTFGDDGRLKSLLHAQLGALQSDLEKHLDPEVSSSVLSRFNANMMSGMNVLVDGVGKLFEVERPGSIGNRLAAQLDANTKILSEQLATAMRELAARSATRVERERSVRKGFDFEDDLEGLLGMWSLPRHDRVVRCATAAGLIPNCKSGDFVVEIAPRDAGGLGLRIVIEAKHHATGQKEARRELERAIENRDAAVGIWVTTDRTCIPKGAPPVFFLDPNRVFVQVDYDETGIDRTLFEVALEVARARAIASRSIEAPAFDMALVSSKIDAALHATTRFSEIKRQLSGIGTGIDRVKSLVDEVRAEVRGSLIALQAEVDRQASAAGDAAA